jgi:hypothetical protein
VGNVTLTKVNETVTDVNSANQFVSPDPSVTTPVASPARLKIIFHVDSSGQVRLLKNVAVLAKSTNQPPDVALITDPSLYPHYAAIASGIGRRVASATFDFGDAAAAQILDLIATNAAIAASTGGDPTNAANQILQKANVDTPYLAFVTGNGFRSAALGAAADAAVAALTSATNGGTTDQVISAALTAATNNPILATNLAYALTLQNAALLPDTRYVTAVRSVANAAGLAAASAANSPYIITASITLTNAAGTTNGQTFTVNGSVRTWTNTVTVTTTQVLTDTNALRAKTNLFNAIVLAPFSQVNVVDAGPASFSLVGAVGMNLTVTASDGYATISNSTQAAQTTLSQITTAATTAGLLALTNTLNVSSVSPGYLTFIGTSLFQSSAGIAAAAASAGAAQAAGGTTTQKRNAANAAALKALTDANIFSAADSIVGTEVLMSGSFGSGGTVTGNLFLGASHPTNPFMHRRHPDHRSGYDITRALRIQFDTITSTNGLLTAGFGVDRITGTYREEIQGLHKPLGPSQNVGLIAEGLIVLDRISPVNTLNQ